MTWLEYLIQDTVVVSVMLALGLLVHYASRRKLKARFVHEGTNAAEYAAPKGLTPAECGMFLAAGVLDTGRMIGATLVDLSARGFLSVDEDDDGVAVLRRTSEAKEDGLKAHEILVFTRFAAPMRLRLEKSEIHEFYKGIFQKFSDAIIWVPASYASDRQQTRALETLLMGLCLAVIAAWIFFVAGFIMSAISALIFFPYVFVSVLGYFSRDQGSEKGRNPMGEIEAYRDFLSMTESLPLDYRTPREWDRHAGYAVAFGLGKKWSEFFSQSVNIQDIKAS